MADSPAKKLQFDIADKENHPFDAQLPVVEIQTAKPIVEIQTAKPIVQVVKKEPQPVTVAPTIRPEETDEPLLQANPQRFVLFPIKYHEVRVTSTSRYA